MRIKSAMVGNDIIYPRRQHELQRLVLKLGLPARVPAKWPLLDLALTHPTFSVTSNYQQLEFIGDAVVRMAASELLLEIYPDSPVGEFSAIRKVLVSDRTLAQLADRYGLEQYLLTDKGAANDASGRQSRLADAFEAVLGALYLSTHTLELIRPWLDPHFRQLAAEIRQDPARQDYKSAFQEWTQAYHKVLPEYRTSETEEFEGNTPIFAAEVWLLGRCYGKGTGRSRKAAEQAAAREALALVNDGRSSGEEK